MLVFLETFDVGVRDELLLKIHGTGMSDEDKADL